MVLTLLSGYISECDYREQRRDVEGQPTRPGRGALDVQPDGDRAADRDARKLAVELGAAGDLGVRAWMEVQDDAVRRLVAVVLDRHADERVMLERDLRGQRLGARVQVDAARGRPAGARRAPVRPLRHVAQAGGLRTGAVGIRVEHGPGCVEEQVRARRPRRPAVSPAGRPGRPPGMAR